MVYHTQMYVKLDWKNNYQLVEKAARLVMQ